MRAPGIFRDSSGVSTGTKKYEIPIYKNGELLEVFKADSPLMISRIEEMAGELLIHLRNKDTQNTYSMKKLY